MEFGWNLDFVSPPLFTSFHFISLHFLFPVIKERKKEEKRKRGKEEKRKKEEERKICYACLDPPPPGSINYWLITISY